jgi:hypothetical protein
MLRIGPIILLLFVLIEGIVSLISPIIVAKAIAFWPKFIIPKLSQTKDTSQTAQDAVRLLDENPEEYARRFRSQLLLIRTGGFISLLIFLVSVLGLLIDASGCCPVVP